VSGSADFDLEAELNQLYGWPPDKFVKERDALASTLRAAGQGEVAAKIKKLRRPVVSAWVINMLSRRAGETLNELLDVGPDLAKAQRLGRWDELRTLTSTRRRLVEVLLKEAGRELSEHGQSMTSTIGADIESTLAGALADPEIAAVVRVGRLDRPVQYAGMGPMPTLRLVADQKPAGGEAVEDQAEPEPDLKQLAADLRVVEARHKLLLDESDKLEVERTRLLSECEGLREQLKGLEAEVDKVEHEASAAREKLIRATRDVRFAKAAVEEAQAGKVPRRSR